MWVFSCTENKIININETSSQSSTKRLASSSNRIEILSFDGDYSHFYKGRPSIRLAILPLSDSQTSFSQGGFYFDPHKAISNVEIQIAHALYSTLTKTDVVTGAPLPSFAESWTIKRLNNGYSYIFTIRDVVWKDGTKITAQHIKNSLLRFLSPKTKNPYAASLAIAIRGGTELYSIPKNSNNQYIKQLEKRVQINAIDDKTLYITASALRNDLLSALSHPSAAILPITDSLFEDESAFITNSDAWSGGLGAFVTTEVTENKIVLEANTLFWEKPWVHTIEFHIVDTLTKMFDLYTNNEIDWFMVPPHQDINSNIATSALQESSLQTTQYSSMVVLDVPENSIFRQVFLPTDVLRKANSDTRQLNYRTELLPSQQNRMDTVFQNFMVHIVGYLHQQHKNTITAKNIPTRIFPSIVSMLSPLDRYPILDVAPSAPITPTQEVQEEYNIPLEISSGSEPITEEINNEESTVGTAVETKDKSIIQTLINTPYVQDLVDLQNNNILSQSTIRIAYTHKPLQLYAEALSSLFSILNIESQIVDILPTNDPASNRYDIAIRSVPIGVGNSLDTLSHLWWILAGGEDSVLQTLGNFNELIGELIYADEIKEYYTLLQKIEENWIKISRFVPLYYVSAQEFIDTKEYPWWTPQRSWHPLFP